MSLLIFRALQEEQVRLVIEDQRYCRLILTKCDFCFLLLLLLLLCFAVISVILFLLVSCKLSIRRQLFKERITFSSGKVAIHR